LPKNCGGRHFDPAKGMNPQEACLRVGIGIDLSQ
jgi:hypothetical protein